MPWCLKMTTWLREVTESSATGPPISKEDSIYLSENVKELCSKIKAGRRSRSRQSSVNDSGGSLNSSMTSEDDRHVVQVSRTKMNAMMLLMVFMSGVICAMLIANFQAAIFYRKQVFQPLPRIEYMDIVNEEDPYLDFGSGLGMKHEMEPECDGDNPLGHELEAIAALHAALDLKEVGKLAKAQKLFQHAVALCPRHPDILTNYGEFVEESRRDYLMADHLYFKALTYAPGHTKALINRKKTLPVVEELDERRLNLIDEKLNLLMQLPEHNIALRRVKKEAYFQHLYHSAGIEGNTMTLSQTRSILETRIAVGGKSLMEHNEILGLDAAMKFINLTLVHRIGEINVQDILNIHKRVMGYVDPSEAGRFRTTQVYVGGHTPPAPEVLSESIENLIQWLNSEEALALHAIHYAAIAHYKLVYIHPFTDGNGRTSRLLMNWILMQAGFPPVIIRKQDRQLYYDHLETANKGDVRPFIRFIADCTEKTVDVYLWATKELSQMQLPGSDLSEEDEVDGTIKNNDSAS